nr:MAHS [Macrobiotus sp. 3 JF-2023a]
MLSDVSSLTSWPLNSFLYENTSLQNGSPLLNVSEIPAQIGAVVHGVQEQLKIVMGISAPSLITPEGFVYYGEKIDKTSAQKEYPTVSEEVHSASKKGAKPEDDAASQAAKRAREFVSAFGTDCVLMFLLHFIYFCVSDEPSDCTYGPRG